MADVLIKVDETVVPEIARAIMAKTGKSDPLKITDFAGEIAGIGGGSNDSEQISYLCALKPLVLSTIFDIDNLTIEKVV